MPRERDSGHGTALSDDALKVLLEVGKDPEGIIEYQPTNSGIQLYINVKPFGDAGAVRWHFALDELRKQGLVAALPGNLKYKLTPSGLEAVNALTND